MHTRTDLPPHISVAIEDLRHGYVPFGVTLPDTYGSLLSDEQPGVVLRPPRMRTVVSVAAATAAISTVMAPGAAAETVYEPAPHAPSSVFAGFASWFGEPVGEQAAVDTSVSQLTSEPESGLSVGDVSDLSSNTKQLVNDFFGDASASDDSFGPVAGKVALKVLPDTPSLSTFVHTSISNVTGALHGKSYIEPLKVLSEADAATDSLINAAPNADPQGKSSSFEIPPSVPDNGNTAAQNGKPTGQLSPPSPDLPPVVKANFDKIEGKAQPSFGTAENHVDWIWPVLGDPAKQTIGDGSRPYPRLAVKAVPKSQIVTVSEEEKVLSIHQTGPHDGVVFVDDTINDRRLAYTHLDSLAKGIKVGQVLPAATVIGRAGTEAVVIEEWPDQINGIEVKDRPICDDSTCGLLPIRTGLADRLAPSYEIWQDTYNNAYGVVTPPVTAPPVDANTKVDTSSDAPASNVELPVSEPVPTPDNPLRKLTDWLGGLSGDDQGNSGLNALLNNPLAVGQEQQADSQGSNQQNQLPPSDNQSTGNQKSGNDHKDGPQKQTDGGSDKRVINLDKRGNDKYARILYAAQLSENKGFPTEYLPAVMVREVGDNIEPDIRNRFGYMNVCQTQVSGHGGSAPHRDEVAKAMHVPEDQITSVYPFKHAADDCISWQRLPKTGNPKHMSDEEMERVAMASQGVNYVNNPLYDEFDGPILDRARKLLAEAKQQYGDPSTIIFK